jgi:acetyl esterase/lipase
MGTSVGVAALEGDVGGNTKTSSAVQLVCDGCGPTDLVGAFKQLPPDKVAWYDDQSPVTLLLGGPVSKHMDLARAASPITYVSKNAPPFLIQHGDADTTVPVAQSQELYDALIKTGAKAKLIIYPGAPHDGFDRDHHDAENFIAANL